MAVRRIRADRLFHAVKTKTLNITTALVMLLSSLGGALPLALNGTAYAQEHDDHEGLSLSSVTLNPTSVTSGGSFGFTAQATSSGNGDASHWKSLKYSINSGSFVCTTLPSGGFEAAGTNSYTVSGLTAPTVTATAVVPIAAKANNKPCGSGNSTDSNTVTSNLTVNPITPPTPTDNTPPQVVINTPGAGVITNSTLAVNVTATDNYKLNTLSVYIADAANHDVLDCTSASGLDSYPAWVTSYTGSCNANVSGLADGTYKVVASAQDRAGNYSNTATQTFTVDRTAPVVTVTPVAGSLLTGAVTFHVTVTDQNLDPSKLTHIWVYLYNATGAQKHYGANVDLSSGSGDFTVDTTQLDDGTAWLDVGKLYDAAGNASGVNDTYFKDYVIDNNGPVVTINTPSNDVVTGDNSVAVNVTATDDHALNTLSVYLTDSLGNYITTCTSASDLDATPAWVTSYTTDCNLNTSSLTDGTYKLIAKSQDRAGNYSNTAVRLITIDRTGPSGFNITAPTNGAVFQSANFTGFDWDDSNDTNGPVTYSILLYQNGSWIPSASGLTASQWSPTAPLSEGNYGWKVWATDTAGNITWNTNGGFDFIIDDTAPTTPTPLTPANNSYQTTNDFYFTWTDSIDSSSAVTYEFQADNDGSFTSPWDSITNGNSEQNHLTTPQIHSTGAPDGDWYWRVRAIDAAGNMSGWSTVWKTTIDTQAPAVPTLTFPADGVYRHTADTNHSDWSVVTDPHGPVTYYYESAFDAAFTNIAYGPHALSANTILNPGEPEVTYYWRVQACDAAGNCSAWSAPRTIHIDNTAPVAQVTAPADGDVLSGTVTVSGTVTDVNPDHYYFVVKDAHGHVVAGPGTVNQATVSDWNWDTTHVADGTYTVDLEARDKAGNKDAGSVSTVTVTVDNTAPVVTINGYGQTDNKIQPDVTATDPAPGTALTYAWTTTVDDTNVSVSDDSVLEPVFTVHHDGTYSFTLTVTDAAGNATAKDFSFTYTTPVAPAVVTPQVTTTTTTPAPAFTNVATTGTGTPTTLADNNNGVLGDSSDGGKVKGDSTVNLKNASDKKNGNFLALGWWWLAVLAVIFALLALLARRRNSEEN